ncbi:MAG TPA: hypothetical protein VHR15_03155 [Ktedonobacterales bacterium]|nr:hypothetical protein [Ktedonobacterales bacterium]
MRRNLLPRALGVLTLLAAAIFVAGRGHNVRAAARADATISGVVVNGTHDNTPLANQQVTLQDVTGDAPREIALSTSDATGHFSFEHINDTGSAIYRVTTSFQGGYFVSAPLPLAQIPASGVTLSVYDVTHSTASLRILSATALFREPRPANGLIGVAELFTFQNESALAFVGTTDPVDGQPMGLLRFALPAGATNITLGKGFDGAQAAQVSAGFGANATVPPGQTQFAFVFDLPYTGTSYTFPLKVVYPTEKLTALIPQDITVQSRDFDDKGPITTAGSQYHLLEHGALDAGGQAQLRLDGLPKPGTPATLDTRLLTIFAGLLALLLALLAGLYIRRGDLAAVFGLAPMAPTRRRAKSHVASPHEEERTALLRQLLTLEQARAKGKLDAEAYRREEAATRDKLKALLIQTDAQADAANGPVVATNATEMSAPEAEHNTSAADRQAQDTLSGGSA